MHDYLKEHFEMLYSRALRISVICYTNNTIKKKRQIKDHKRKKMSVSDQRIFYRESVSD